MLDRSFGADICFIVYINAEAIPPYFWIHYAYNMCNAQAIPFIWSQYACNVYNVEAIPPTPVGCTIHSDPLY